MKNYIGLGSKLPKSVSYPNTVDSENWLRKNVYISHKKAEQKEILFAKMASEKSMKEFVTKYDIFHISNINQYQKELTEALAKAYPNPDKDGNDEHWKLILLGLAISHMQRRYMSNNHRFDCIRVDKKIFDQYMTESTKTRTEQTIASYLVSIACEKYGEVINYNALSDLQLHMLQLIYENTIGWINEMGQTVDGQYKLLNTLSSDEVSKIVAYKEAAVDDRLRYMAECKRDFLGFLSYLWKIMLNICQEKVHEVTEISVHSELLYPVHYMVPMVKEYVCLNFPEDKYVNSTVILPSAMGDFPGIKRKIVERMVKMSQKPGKWFFAESKLMRGKNYYKYSTANVNENPTVVDLGEDSFYIECMDCIGIGEGEWDKTEICSQCIFSIQCVKEGE